MSKDKKVAKDRLAFSRRDFLKTSAAAGALTSTLSVGSTAEASATPVELQGPDPVPISLRINGNTHRLSVEPRVTLLDALRDHLDLTGSKKVCDRSTCGACTVMLNDKLAYACSVLAIEAQGVEILTIEGIGTPQDLHPIQETFIETDATQCGFCTPGFVVSVKAMLDRNPKMSDAELRESLGGNLCRCGTYAGIREAVAALTKGGSNG